MRISDWSSDVCSSDLRTHPVTGTVNSLDDRAIAAFERAVRLRDPCAGLGRGDQPFAVEPERGRAVDPALLQSFPIFHIKLGIKRPFCDSAPAFRSEEPTSEPKSLMRTSHAVFRL